jgi:hypothetical protein
MKRPTLNDLQRVDQHITEAKILIANERARRAWSSSDLTDVNAPLLDELCAGLALLEAHRARLVALQPRRPEVITYRWPSMGGEDLPSPLRNL